MAAPRIFLSSTYYDLKQIRNDIGNSIEQLGYQVVRHERSDIPYDGTRRLEESCYDEITSCDIVVCVIGNAFGTKSDINSLSITMNELERAFDKRKIVYVYVDKSVLIENRTYRKNSGSKDFAPAIVDDIAIHKYIADLQDRMGNTKPITPFETAEDIIVSLKSQLAGLFQSLLNERIASSAAKDISDLHSEVELLKQTVKHVEMQGQDFFTRFQGTVLARNPTIAAIEKHLGINKFRVIIKDIYALDEAMSCFGFTLDSSAEVDDAKGIGVGKRIYKRERNGVSSELVLESGLFDEKGNILVLPSDTRNRLISFSEHQVDDDADCPF